MAEMAQIQAHQGYIEADGRLVFSDVRIRTPKNIKVTVLWEESPIIKTKPQRQKEALEKMLASLDEITDEPLDNEFFEIVNSGTGVSREVEL